MLCHERPLRISGPIDAAGWGGWGERAARRSIRTPAVNITPIASPRGRMRGGRRGIGKLLQRERKLEEFTLSLGRLAGRADWRWNGRVGRCGLLWGHSHLYEVVALQCKHRGG